MSKRISLMDANAYESFVSSLIAGDGEAHLLPSQIESLPSPQEIDFMEGRVGADDAGVIVTIDDTGNLKEFAYYPTDVQVVKYFD